MLIASPPYWLWSIWPDLSVLNHLFFVVLSAVALYCVWSSINILVSARTLRKVRPAEGVGPTREPMTALRNHAENMRQAIGAATYLFGFVFFVGLQFAPRTLGDGPSRLETQVLRTFVLLFAFAANVFLIFLAVHLLSWFACRQIQLLRSSQGESSAAS